MKEEIKFMEKFIERRRMDDALNILKICYKEGVVEYWF
jgi:hypothetical protein